MLLGVAACIPAAIIELAMQAVLGKSVVEAQGHFLDAFLVAAFTEESLKLACVLLYLWRKPQFDEVMDGILYCAAASLGFAMLENVLYAGGNIETGLFRAFTAVPLHAFASALMGYFVGRAKLAARGSVGWLLAGLAVAVGSHGLYDWAVLSKGTFGFGGEHIGLGLLLAFALVVVLGCAVWVASRDARRLDDALFGPASRPLPTAFGVASAAAPGMAYVGMPVFVLWTDGVSYPARLLGGQGSHFFCELGNGVKEWVPRERVMVALAPAF